MMPGMAEGKNLQFHVIHPGQILPPGAALPPGVSGSVNANIKMMTSLKDGYKVEISRENSKPASVVVTREKEKWEATEGDLSKLPEQVRPEVEKLLHSGPFGVQVMSAPFHVELPQGLPPGFAPANLELRMKEMDRKIEDLRKKVEELQGKAGVPSSETKQAPEKKHEKKMKIEVHSNRV
jgi:hypothetical protein